MRQLLIITRKYVYDWEDANSNGEWNAACTLLQWPLQWCTVKTQKRKAANLLFEEIEHDVKDKEKFVVEQTEKLKQMHQSYLTMLDYEKVLENVAKIMPKLA